MGKKYPTIHQHEPLRVPSEWNGSERRFVAQIEELLDDLYRRLNRLRLADMSVSLREMISSSADGVQENRTAIEQTNEQISLLATQESIDALTGQVQENSTAIQQTSNQIALKASQSAVDALTGQVQENSTAIQQTSNQIALKASQSAVDALTGQVQENSTAIQQTSNQIALKASQSAVDALTGQVQENTATIALMAGEARIAVAVEDSGGGSEIYLSKEGLRFTGNEIAFNVQGSAGDTVWDEDGLSVPSVNSPSVVPQYTGPLAVTVNPTAAPNGKSVFRSLSDACNALSHKYLRGAVEVTVTAGYTESVPITLQRCFGAPITLKANSVVNIAGTMVISDVPNRVTLRNLSLSSSDANAHVLLLENASHVSANGCKFIGAGSLSEWRGGVYANLASNFYAEACHTQGRQSAFMADSMSQISTYNCTGSNHTCVFRAYKGSHCSARGTYPSYSSYLQYSDNTGTFVIDSGATQSAGTSSGTPTTMTTVTLNATDTRTNYGGQWYNTQFRQLTQGIAAGTTFRGGMWFNVSGLSGKTVQAATLTFTRLSGAGAGSDITVCLGTHNNAGASGGFANVATYGAIGVAQQRETVSVSIPPAAVQALISGAAKGLYLYSTDTSHWGDRTYSRNYAQFAGVGAAGAPTLTVQYR